MADRFLLAPHGLVTWARLNVHGLDVYLTR